METKKAKTFALIAACLLATCALLRLIGIIPSFEYLPVMWLLFRLLSIGAIAGIAVMLFMNRRDWVFIGICAGGATMELFYFFSNPSAAGFFGLLAILGVGALAFLKMRGMKIIKFLFYAPAALELITYLCTGSLSIMFDYGFFGMLQSFLAEQLLIAGYLMFGFWILKVPDNENAPADNTAAMYGVNPAASAGVYSAPVAAQPVVSAPAPAAAATNVQQAPETQPQQGARFCIYCGKKNDASDCFCANCGSRLV